MNTELRLESSRTLKAMLKDSVYARAWPMARLLARRVYPAPRPDQIALTFDDGPNPLSTPRLLDFLISRNIRASFFLVGMHAYAEPALVRRISAEGHLIGNHTWSHPNLRTIPKERVVRELQRASQTLEDITGKPIRFFRPPFGSADRSVLAIARELGLMPTFWNAMTADWESRSAAQIANDLELQIACNETRGRATCLVLHDRRADEPDACCDASVDAVMQLVGAHRASHSFVTMESWV